MSDLLSREQILEAQDLVTERVEVPEWGGAVMVRSLTAAQMERVQEHIRGKGVKGATASLVAMAVVDEAGKRLFTDADLAGLGKKGMAAMQRVLRVVMRLNALERESLEALAKNSANGQGDVSLSD